MVVHSVVKMVVYLVWTLEEWMALLKVATSGDWMVEKLVVTMVDLLVG